MVSAVNVQTTNVSANTSKMVCYPCVFSCNDKWYMLFNGNGYGKTGFGIARLTEGEI